MPKYFLLDRENEVLTITINYPEKRNMMNDEMGREFHGICSDVAKDDKVRAVIITGAGKAFCAGGDLDWLLKKTERTPGQNREDMVEFYNLFLKVRDIKVPVIAAINGAAVGAGMVLPLACDIRLIARSARIGVTFAKLGLNPGMGCTWLLPRLVGPQRAIMLTATGRLIDGEEAFRMGIAEGVYDDDKLMPEARKLAEEIAANSPLAVRWAKRTVWKAIHTTIDEHLEDESLGQSFCYATEDFVEGIKAMQEKRKPNFRGK